MDRPKHKSSTVHAPFAVSPSVAVTLEVSILPFFSDRFHYTGTSVLIRPRRLKNSSLRLSVPVLDSGEFREHFYVWWQKSSTTGHGVYCIEASNDFHCLQQKKERKKEKKETTNESRFFSANREEFQREKSEKGRVLSADVCTRCLWRDIITRNVSSVLKITKGGFLGKSEDDSVGDTTRGGKYFSRFQ